MAVTTFVELKAITSEFMAKMAAARGEMESFQKKHTSASAAVAKAGGMGLAAVVGAAGAIAVASVKMAGDFQSAAQHLVTDAGESQKALGMIEKGMLAVGQQTGTSSKDIVNGMYHIESAGFHGAAGLSVLRVAAEGAKVGNADLDTVSKTLSGTVRSYYGDQLTAGEATKRSTQVMNELVAITGTGDLRMQDLASSLGNVTPVAAAAGLSLAQVGGAIATMTAQNMTAQQATQDLANLIRNLSAPNNVAKNEMAQFGLNSNTVSEQLGKRGLTGTVALLTEAITSRMGPAGMVLFNAFNQSQGAATDMRIELSKMSPATRKVAESLQAGTMTAGEWRKAIKNLPYDQKNLAQGFAATYTQSHRFNDLLKSGSPAAQTFNQALEKMTGGATGLNTSLMLSGSNRAAFNDSVKKIGDAAQKSGAHVDNWDKIQKTFNQQLAVAKTTVENLGISLGLKLIPMIEKVVGFMAKHSQAVVVGLFVIAGAFGVMAAAAVAAFVAENLATLGIVAGIMALVAAAIYVATHWKQVWSDIKHWFDDALSFLRTGVGQLVLLILGPLAPIAYLALHWQRIWHDIKAWTLDAVNAIVGFFTRFASDVAHIFSNAVSWLSRAGKDIVNGLWTGIQAVWHDVIRPFFNGIKTLFIDFFTKGAGSWLIKGGTDILSGLWAGIKSVWDHIVAPFFRDIVKPIVTFFVTAVTWLFDAGRRVMSGLFNGLFNVANTLRTWLTVHIFSPVVGFFAGAITWLFNAGVSIISGMFNGIWQVASGAARWLNSNVFQPILHFFGGANRWLLNVGGDIIGGLFAGIWQVMKTVGGWINSNVFQPIVHAVKAFFGISSPSSVMMGLGVHVMEGFVAGLLKANPLAVVKKVFGSVANAVAMIFGGLGGSGNTAGVSGPAVSGIPKSVGTLNLSSVQTGQLMAAQYGWTGAEWNALYNLWNGESGWNKFAENVSSGAYGIPQALPASKMASAGADWSTNAATQIAWGLSYIRSVYGDPARAYSMWLGRSPHWYDQGGLLPPGLSLALNTTGHAEVVRPGPAGDTAGPVTVVLQVDGKTLGSVVLTQLLREQRNRPLGIRAS